jgi:arginyl-tRNA synthetase
MLHIEEKLISRIKDIIFSLGVEAPPIEVETPRSMEYGDISTNIALKLTRLLRKNPQEIARAIVERVEPEFSDVFEKIEVVAPGFINFFFSWDFLRSELKEILHCQDYGRNELGKGIKVLIEFVSANPTGPLSIAHARQAAIGSSLARILEFSGYNVDREYYINDEGTQIDLLGASLKARCLQLLGEEVKVPEDGYQGEYLIDLAKKMIQEEKLDLNKVKELEDSYFSDYAVKEILSQIKEELSDFGVQYDHWTSQRELRISGKIEKVLEALKEKGFLYEKDNALWFSSSKFGDDQDRVVRRSDGTYTYFAADIAYHKDKFERGYEVLIDLWGPDHHGYIPRVKASVQALGYNPEDLKILIVQLATVYRAGKPIALSTRKGQLLTLKEVVDEIGKDATLYFLLTRKLDSHLDFDLEIAKKQSMENPVYYIQYAHARIASILKFASDRGFQVQNLDTAYLNELKEEEEKQILRTLVQFPRIIKISALTFEPSLLTTYLHDLASKFHSFYNKFRVVTEDEKLTYARLGLCKGLMLILRRGLGLLGISAPEKM